MQLPNIEAAVIPPEKIVDYLLSVTHPKGRSKAQFFMQFGFTLDQWQVLGTALKDHARVHEVAKTEMTPYGITYVIEGDLDTPSGRSPTIRAVWFISNGEDASRLATAYPIAQGE